MEANNENTKIEELKGTPFHIVSYKSEKEGEKHFIVLGINRVSPLYDTKQQAVTYATKNNNWELMCAVIGVIAEKIITDLKNK